MRIVVALACALLLAACSPKPPGGPIVLTYASSYGPTHPFSRADIDWMKHVETASSGRLKIKPYWSGSLLSADQGMTELRHGVADIGLVTPIYVRAGAQVTSGQTAFYAGVETIEQQVAVYKCLARDFPALRNEMAGLRVLAVQGGNLPGVITRNRPVASLADLKGLRLRVPEELVAVLKAAGADPVSMPMGEVYPAMAKGVVDGVIVSPDTLKAMHFSEVAKYYSDLHAPRGAYPARAISEASFRRLPPELQQVLIASEPVWEAAIARSVTKAAEGGLKWGRAEKMTFVTATPEAQKAFDDFYIATTAREAHRLNPYGVDGEAMLAEAQRLIGAARGGRPVVCGGPT